MSKPSVLAIIPARGGSKRLPRKNVKLLNGKPLLAYSIEAAMQAPSVTDVVVSSEDEAIRAIAATYPIQVINRPAALACDTVSNEMVVKHAVEHFTEAHDNPDYIVLLQPTSPLRNGQHIEACLRHFMLSSAKSTLSVCLASHHPGKYMKINNDNLIPYTHIDDVEKRSQLLDEVYRQNGAIYALRTQDFLNTLTFYQTPCLPYIMEREVSVDIDSQFDLNFCQFLIECAKSLGEETHAG